MFYFGTSSWGDTRKLPQAFTEQGEAMLSSVLRSKRAVSVNIEIMRAFVRLRKLLASNADDLVKSLLGRHPGESRGPEHLEITGFRLSPE